MANSVSDPKVEDVLSSVRRLVSGEIPRKMRSPLPKGPGALVLTNAHRVAKDPLSRTSSRSLEDRIAELEAAVDDRTDEFEPDGSEDQAQNVPDRIVYTRPPSSDEQADIRRNTLRLSEIALIQTGPTNETDNAAASDIPVQFRHEGKAKDVAIEKVKGLIGDNGAPAEGPTFAPFEPTPDSVRFSSNIGEIAEAPMAEDVPTMPPRRADVTVFTNPDDFVERIEARIDRGEDEGAEAPIAHKSQPDSGDTLADAEENMLREDIDLDETGETEDDFNAALSEAVEASVTSAVFEEIANTDLAAEHCTEDTVVLPKDAPISEMEDLDLEAAGMAEIATVEEPDAPEGDVQGQEQSSTEPQSVEVISAEAPSDEALVDEAADKDAAVAETPAIDAVLLGDDALKAKVAQLIRQELQGELGERITRNVRKLVRREIKRALDTRDIV